ncbi:MULTISPECIES: histidine phosphatase family protein [Ramlibacter]|uniref:Histidine phosphatase family protein n=1 Tax=Ramlibacter pinisoli TaxID=2682844 RepID=A0A6N8IZX9_9BURK|nr:MULTISPECIES: histidine phosphatase family protein [Ramlibacter]MBA2962602.1 histidine phosphatase family protein [Ramlibacter sp. CGMCC 1.13660]MVQ32544.1 histidine phosphatase family protein [Ramlibacter pinisoli]
MTPNWPSKIWIVRHGQSAGNVARDAAEAAGLVVIDIADRDIDVPLSDLGREQAVALGHWFGSLAPGDQPEVVITSPYVRARQTTRLLMEAAGLDPRRVRLRIDERLREKEFGILDRLTVRGIRERHPELAAQRSHVGKFYFRPPGGESWCDVVLRLRSVVEMVSREHDGQRVLVVAHQVIVHCMRYLLECLEEHEVLALDRQGDVPNCGVTSYRLDPQARAMAVDLVNFVAPLRQAGTPITREPDAMAAPKP